MAIAALGNAVITTGAAVAVSVAVPHAAVRTTAVAVTVTHAHATQPQGRQYFQWVSLSPRDGQ